MMNHKIIPVLPALLLAICLLFGACTENASPTEPTEPEKPAALYAPITEIDHCVLEPDDRAALSDADMRAYRALTEAMLERKDDVQLKPDTASVARLLELLAESPYYFFLSGTIEDGNTVRFSYAYPADLQRRMLSFMDSAFLRIANHEASDSDNALDVILKIYLAVTHEMAYDRERTDNKELGSPLFVYPADEIYKALRDKKSLCYGFAYVMRFALLQRGIDCFCVYGQCTARGDGHEWILFRYDGAWFHCDPAWDRVTDDYAKLIHFGKTDREREVDTLEMTDFSAYHSADYGAVECTDNRFSIFRGITRFSYINGHHFYMTDGQKNEYIFDTETFSFI